MHALIIEPQPLIRLLLEDELLHLGFTSFDSATTKKGAIALAKRRPPDLLTASLRLMDGCGVDAVRTICSSKAVPTIFIVSSPKEAREVLGGSTFITKPVARMALQKAVNQVMPSPTSRSQTFARRPQNA